MNDDKALQEQLDIDRANDVSPDPYERIFGLNRKIGPVEAAMTHSTLGKTIDELCEQPPGTFKQSLKDGVDPDVAMLRGSVDHTPALTGQMPAEEQFPALQRKPVKRLFPDWFYGNTEAVNKLAKEQCGIPRDRDFVDPEVIKNREDWNEEKRNDSTFALASEGTEGDRIRESLSRQHCPQCEPNIGGTKPALHPTCYRQQQEDALFKRTWMVVGGVIVILTGVAWFVLK